MSLAERVLNGERLALARLLTLIENETPEGLEALAAIYSHTGRAHRVGVTGAPGTGKSTLVNQLALHLRRAGDEAPTVAIVAVDPSSPFSGGAILGDRIRMRDLAGDRGVFIRSMASRGALGGVARATAAIVEALDAAGFDIIIIETVGAGQAEVDIARTAHTTVVVDAPGLGDDVQAIKAGILEIADVLVVNKSDLPGAENTLRALRSALRLAHPQAREEEGEAVWVPPVLATVATRGEGIGELAAAIGKHRSHLLGSGQMAAREEARVRSELEALLREHLMRRFLSAQPDGRFDAVVQKVLARELAPTEAIRRLLEEQDEG